MLSIIIPTFNEADQIAETIRKIEEAKGTFDVEIIVIDGGSTDNTVEIVQQTSTLIFKSEKKGRAAQMNKGAAIAKYDLLYFLHADSIPPPLFTNQIITSYQNGATSGCFRLRFDNDHWFLKVNAWFTKFDVNAVRFGDQSLFVTKEIFQKSRGFREDLLMMEDQEIIHRLKEYGKFKVINDFVITSARKYRANGIFRIQSIFFRIWTMYYLGFSQETMLKTYRRLIKNHKM